MRRRLTFLLIAPALCATDQYVGAEACRRCHPAVYDAQIASRHARALRPIAETPLPGLLIGAPIRERNGVAFEYEMAGGDLVAKLSRGASRLQAPLVWAFGAGAQAYTPVGVYGGRFFEHRVSYYTSAMRPGRTLGHPGAASQSLEEALGLIQETETIERCFACHATNARPGPDLARAIPGVSCQRCHGPGEPHITSAAAKDVLPLSRLSARELIEFCAQCHRAPAPGALLQSQLDDPMSIRFQPLGLLASSCFRKSGALSCITCHNPHEDARHDGGYYAQKCNSCHAGAPSRSSKCARVANADCVSCHMQRRSPAEFLTFTDHRIRVYR